MQPMSFLSLTSPAFLHDTTIPVKHTCDSEKEISPCLTISGVPEESKSLVLILEDPDIPEVKKKEYGSQSFDHWILFNIPPGITEIPEGETAGTPGVNSAGTLGYVGPCPPPHLEPQEHRYFFRLYAIDTILTLEEGAEKSQILAAIEGHTLATAELIGRYSRA